jgi:hypothetical protein
MENRDGIIICDSSMDVNRLAFSLCEFDKKTLIFIQKTTFVPTIYEICNTKERVFITESNAILETVIDNFDTFDMLIFVNKNLNDFENEFFRQIQTRNSKKIIQIKNSAVNLNQSI